MRNHINIYTWLDNNDYYEDFVSNSNFGDPISLELMDDEFGKKSIFLLYLFHAISPSNRNGEEAEGAPT